MKKSYLEKGVNILAWIAIGFIISYCILHVGDLFAQSLDIGGTDSTNQMKDVKNFMTTLQKFGFKFVAPLLGGFLVIQGVYKVACREFTQGALATFGGGALFFIEKIADSLSKMGGS